MTRLAILLMLLGPAGDSDLVAEAFEQFERGDYDDALDTIDRAMETNSDPNLLYARASILEKLERHEDAIDGYERFLATGPNREQAEKAYERIQVCRKAIEANDEKHEEVPVPQPPVTDGAPAPVRKDAQGEPAPRQRMWHRDPFGGLLLGTGSALRVAGGVLLGGGASRRLGADGGSTEDEFRQDLQSSTTMQLTGIAVAVTGGLLVGGAALRYVSVKRASMGPEGLAIRF